MARLRAADAEKRITHEYGPDFLESLARGITILTAFDGERRQMTLSDVARLVDLPRATVRRALYTLTCLGYLESDGRLFRLTPKVLRLAASYLTSDLVTTVVQPSCDRIAKEVAESCTAAVLDDAEIVMIARAAPARLLAVGVGIGYRIPAFCSALGRVLLAALPDDALDAFLAALQPAALTEHTLTDKSQLRAAILTVRQQGFAFADQEAEIGFRSIAVPLQRYDGRTVAALNIGARVERAPPETMLGVYLPTLRREAAALRDQLI